MSYNEEQQIAINHNKGPMMVLAGPGSGKTHVITNRIAKLIDSHNVSPENILVITFTKLAASEMEERFQNTYKSQVPVTFGTFHGIFYGILRWKYKISNDSILNDREKKKIITEIINGYDHEDYIDVDLDMEEDFVENIIKLIAVAKGENKNIDEFECEIVPTSTFRKIYKDYEIKRNQMKKLDFDDMICQCYRLLKENKEIRQQWQERFQYILIDEFQDINKIQFDTIKLLLGKERNIFIVGDDDQSIYGFRGAKPEIMLNFKKEFQDTKIVLLKVNYRSTQSIVKGASKLIAKNENRFKKEVNTINPVGASIHVQELKSIDEESTYVIDHIKQHLNNGLEYKDISVIYRTNIEVKNLASNLVRCNIPFQMKDRIPNIFEHFIAKDIKMYMDLAHGRETRQNIIGIINKPNRYVKRNALDGLDASLEALRETYVKVDYMYDRIVQLELDLRVLKNTTPYAFIEYLRVKVGYNDYIKDHADYYKVDVKELEETINQIQEMAKQFKSVDEWLEFVKDYGDKLEQSQQNYNPDENAVRLHTMHGAKGLEFEHVLIIGCNEDITPNKKAKMPLEIEEERRMFYVAMTRAKKNLTLIYSKERNGKTMSPSRFVLELLN